MNTILRFINSPISSNSFLIKDINTQLCIIIDPGSCNYNSELQEFIKLNKLSISFVILTHEHFDHIAGVNSLLLDFKFELLCSKATAKALTDTKLNLSEFNDLIEPVYISKNPKIVNDRDEINFGGEKILFYHTPGHSQGSMCITFSKNFFSGDTILKNFKTRLNLPGSNKIQYNSSIERIKPVLIEGMNIYPGHGEPFIYDNNEILFK